MSKNNKLAGLEIELPSLGTKEQWKKRVIVTSSVIGLLFGVFIGSGFFYERFDITYRSPIVIQSPIVITPKAMVSPLPSETIEIEEATESAQVVEPTPTPEPEPQMSNKLIEHINARPDVWEAISNLFQADKVYAGELLARESSFDPTIVNSIGACGLPQAYGCEKMDCPLEDTPEAIQCQLEWFDEYVEGRYGTMEDALEFHDQKGWY